MRTAKFGDLKVGTKIRLENCYGAKINPIPCESSSLYYANQGKEFAGWNFAYKFMGHGEDGLMSLRPDTEVVVIYEEPDDLGMVEGKDVPPENIGHTDAY